MEKTKITIHKDDEVVTVAERLIDSPGTHIVVSIPRFSKFATSPTHLRLLKREAEALGKTLEIESVDENILEICESEELASSNPFFDNETAHMTDISHARESQHEGEPRVAKHEGTHHMGEPRKSGKRRLRLPLPSFPTRGKTVVGITVVAALSLILFVGLGVLPRAEVRVTTAKTQRSYTGEVVVAKSIENLKTDKPVLLGQVFSQTKNGSFSFPATGEGKIERKARGTITIYNAYGSEPQQLVATTRFQAPDGKIYRIQENITVPGAKIESGSVVAPGSIKTTVFADQPGDAYNSAPIDKFVVPGFKGSKKFEGFYAVSDGPISGGFTGTGSFPTDEDITAAEKSAEEALRESVKTVFVSQLPAGFRFVDGASRFSISKRDINPELDSEGKFSVFIEGEFSAMVFKEEELLHVFRKEVLTEAGDSFKVADDRIVYGKPTFITNEAMEIPMEYQAMLSKIVNEGDLKDKIAGKSEADIRSIVFSFPGLERAQISFWPFWVKSVPQDADKITVTLD